MEIIVVDCPEIPVLPSYASFTYSAEKKLVSHRLLFQSVFDRWQGVILHLANKECEGRGGFWFASDLMDWGEDDALVFRPEARVDVIDLLQRLLSASPAGHLIFATDYQFGTERKECGEATIEEFFALHDRRELRYNTIWYLRAG
jgi:hypothetical protein